MGEHGFGTCGLLFESVYPIVTKPGSAANSDAPCVEGSVFKQTYYRNETLNPGLTASSSLGNETSAQTETHHPTVRAHRTAALGTAHSLTDHHAATLFAALAGVCAAAASPSSTRAAAAPPRRRRKPCPSSSESNRRGRYKIIV